MDASELMAQQAPRLNPFDLNMTQRNRFYSILKQRGVGEHAGIWEAVSKLSEEDIDYTKNGAKGAVNIPYRTSNGAYECDNGYLLNPECGLAAPHEVRAESETTISGKPWREWMKSKRKGAAQ